MARIQLQRYPQILSRILSRVIARSDLTDVTDAATYKQHAAAFARELEEAYFQLAGIQDVWDIDTASGQDLDVRAAEITPDGLTRLGARRAVGTLQFSRPGTTGDIFIPQGSTAKDLRGFSYSTTVSAFITNGTTNSGPIPAVADQAGERYDADGASVTVLASQIAGVTAVTNPAAFTGGRLEEGDASFRDRIRIFTRSLAGSTPDAIRFALVGLEDATTGKQIESVSVFEDPIARGNVTVYVDDGAGTIESTTAVVGENVTAGLLGPPADSAVGGEEFLDLDNTAVKELTQLSSSVRGVLVENQDYYFNPATGRIFFDPPLVNAEVITANYTRFTGLIEQAYLVLYGDPSDRITYPGVVAAGERVLVAAPTKVDITVAGVLAVEDGFGRDAVIADVEAAVLNYLNELPIGEDVVFNRIIDIVMSVSGVLDVQMDEPTANIPILDSQLARSTVALVDFD